MINKNTDIRYIKGIGEKRAELFNKLGVFALATCSDTCRAVMRTEPICAIYVI